MEDFDFYPPKPELVEQQPKSGLSMTIFSLVLFIMVFVFIAGDELDFILQLVLVLIIHELGHFLTMKWFGYENVRMLFIPLMGAFVQGKKRKYSQKESFLVTVAGPFPGVLLGVLSIWAATLLQNDWWMSLGLMFLLLNIINLLPLDPLDGGQLFKLLFRRQHELFLMIFAFISSIFMIGVGWYFDSFIIMAFGFLMGFRVRALQKRYQVHKELKEKAVNFSTTYKGLSNKDFLRIKSVVIEHTPALQKFIDQVPQEESDPVLASQVNNVLDVPLKRDASFGFKAALILFWLLSFLSPILLFFLLDIKWYFDAV